MLLIKKKSLAPTTHTDKNPAFLKWGLLILLSLIWGSSYILIKKGLVAFSPEQLAALRISISALSFAPILAMTYKNIDWSKLKYLLIVGFTGSFIPAFLFAFAQTEINSSMAGVLSSLTPLFTLILGILFFKLPFVSTKVVGVLIGLAGASFLILFGADTSESGNLWYGLFIVCGCMFYAASVNTIKTYLQDMSSMDISAASFPLVGIPGILFLLSTNFTEVLQTHEAAWSSLGYIIILAIFGTVISSLLFFRLVLLTNAVFASTVSYLIPMISLFWGAADGEVITLFHFLGMGLILFGVYVTRK